MKGEYYTSYFRLLLFLYFDILFDYGMSEDLILLEFNIVCK